MSKDPVRALGTFDQFAACQQFTESLSRLDLSGVRAYLLDAIHKRIDASVEGFERKGGYQVSFLGEAEGFENGKYTVGTLNWVPLSSASPSLLMSRTGSQPNSSSTLIASHFFPL